MEHFVDFWNQLGYGQVLFVLLVFFFLLHLFLLVYRASVLPRRKRGGEMEAGDGVSVIITCANQSELLQENLASFLEQDYPDFEVIVVDECSEDDTHVVLSDFQKRYPRLKTSWICPGTKFRRTKKLAINLGVLAARNDILLFSEIGCRPAGRNWISGMRALFREDTAVVVGYANYGEGGRTVDARRYFRFLRYWKSAFMVRSGMNYAGNGYNMGYRKKYYLEKRGFAGNTQEYIGYDTDMVRELSGCGRVRMAGGADTAVIIGDDRRKVWRDDHSYAYASQARFPFPVRLWANLDMIVETLFFLTLLYFVWAGPFRLYFAAVLLPILLLDLLVVNICMRRMGMKRLFLTSLVLAFTGFAYKFYYTVYGLLTVEKWR